MSGPEALRASQAALQVAIRTRDLLEHFPPRGYAALRDQIIRSAESIGSNTAEGHPSIFDAEFIRFLATSIRSAGELNAQLSMAVAYGIVPKRKAFNVIGTVICTKRMLKSLRDSIELAEERKRAARADAKKRRKSKESKESKESTEPKKPRKSKKPKKPQRGGGSL